MQHVLLSRNMRRATSMILALMCTVAVWAQKEIIEVSSHVVDATTGEVLPYANVISTKGVATITNANGDFTLKVETSDSLRISFVGYETAHVKANKLPTRLKLAPMSRVLTEVQVIPWESILVKAGNKLAKQYRKSRKEESCFFYRMTTNYRRKNMAEAFVTARSSANLRNISFITGRYGKLTPTGLTMPTIANMNFHHPLELGPMVQESPFWRGLRTPIPEMLSLHYLNIYYDVEGEELTDNKGNSIYKFHLKRKKNKNQFSILTGTLYFEANSLKLLKFEGQVENMYLDIYKDFYHTDSRLQIDLTVNYSHDKGYTQVQSITYRMTNGDMSSQAILYNVDNIDLHLDENINKKTGENMLASISNAGFDQILWDHSNIIQRTREEEILAGMPDQSMLVNQSTEETPSTPMQQLVDHLRRFGKSLPQEKVYLHTDNTSYFIGDTLWFSAYTTQTNDNKPSQISGVLYVELYNHEGYLVERKLIEMRNGRGNGNFVIGDNAYPGFYELRAYTRWQLNWGLFHRPHAKVSEEWFISKEMHDNFYRDYDKLYSRVFPVYDKPIREGEYTERMTRKSPQHANNDNTQKRQMQLTFYPEGGNLVAGLPCRIAFEAAWNDGQELEGHLQDVQAENRGRGTIEVTAQAGEKREMTFTTTDGQEVKAMLPEAVRTGVALRVNQEHDNIDISVNRTNDLKDTTLGLTIMCEGVVQAFFTLTEKEQHIYVPKTDLKVGVNQATVFDAQGRVWADRLFFVKDDNTTRSSVVINGVKESYQPYEPIQLTVTTPAHKGGNISLSVRDASNLHTLYDNASILTEMLLTSEIKGFVPNPEFYFEKNDNFHNRALDLLMLTQGWRRFKWQEMAVKDVWQLTQPAERTPIITGKVYITSGLFLSDNYGKEREKTDGTETTDRHWQPNVDELLNFYNGKTHELSDIIYYTDEDNTLFNNKGIRVHALWMPEEDSKYHPAIDIDTKDGYFKVQMPRFYGSSLFFLSAADTLKWKENKGYRWIEQVKRNRQGYPPSYQVRINLPYPRFVNPYNYYQTHPNFAYDPQHSTTVGEDGSQQGSSPALVVDAYEAYNAALDAGFGQMPDDIVRTYMGDYGINKPYIQGVNGSREYRIKEKLVYNINPKDIENTPSYIDKYEIYTDYEPRLWGDERYLGDNLPETQITICPYPDAMRREFYRDRRYELHGFSYAKEFYHPNYTMRKNEEHPKDYRRTLYWNPNLQLDDDGTAKLMFYNNSYAHPISVNAQGICKDGSLLSGEVRAEGEKH